MLVIAIKRNTSMSGSQAFANIISENSANSNYPILISKTFFIEVYIVSKWGISVNTITNINTKVINISP